MEYILYTDTMTTIEYKNTVKHIVTLSVIGVK